MIARPLLVLGCRVFVTFFPFSVQKCKKWFWGLNLMRTGTDGIRHPETGLQTTYCFFFLLKINYFLKFYPGCVRFFNFSLNYFAEYPISGETMNYHAAKAFILDKLEQELSDKLTYHGLHHTLDVLHATEELCRIERIAPYESMLLKTAALFHDSGFTLDNKNHEELGCQIAKANLPLYDYSGEDIDLICGMIMATKIPQSPQNYLEAILCDADLDYLGRDDFHQIGATLFEELQAYNILHHEEAWNRLQVNFLEKHTFFTRTNRLRRNRKKQFHLRELKKVVAGYPNP